MNLKIEKRQRRAEGREVENVVDGRKFVPLTLMGTEALKALSRFQGIVLTFNLNATVLVNVLFKNIRTQQKTAEIL